jgi:phosphoribosylformylglycinamidine synthase
VAAALTLAGGAPEIVHVNQLRNGERAWVDYQMLVLPGGFAYGDALGAGRLTALDLNVYFADEVRAFIDAGKPVVGICNGFQALVKAGLLPGSIRRTTHDDSVTSVLRQTATLARNAGAHFECRWVTLLPNPGSPCLFTRGLNELITCPVAHGEGNFIPCDDGALTTLKANGQIALTYAGSIENLPRSTFRFSEREAGSGNQSEIVDYPANPNGSVANIAGVCNVRGNVLGLMPHPENHIYSWQHPRWTRGERGGLGLALFENAIRQM